MEVVMEDALWTLLDGERSLHSIRVSLERAGSADGGASYSEVENMKKGEVSR